jgi:hypothetical protein
MEQRKAPHPIDINRIGADCMGIGIQPAARAVPQYRGRNGNRFRTAGGDTGITKLAISVTKEALAEAFSERAKDGWIHSEPSKPAAKTCLSPADPAHWYAAVKSFFLGRVTLDSARNQTLQALLQ